MRKIGDRARSGVPGAGLCNSCMHQRAVVSGRGSAFSLCRLSVVDPRFPRYPSIPVLACDGYGRGETHATDEAANATT